MNLPIILSGQNDFFNFRNTVAQGKHEVFYRIENQNIDSSNKKYKGFRGMWFGKNLDFVLRYVAKNQELPGVRLLIVAIPKDIATGFNISNRHLSFTLNCEPEQFIIDREDLPENSYLLELDLDQVDKIGWNENSRQLLDGLSGDINRILN